LAMRFLQADIKLMNILIELLNYGFILQYFL